MKKSNLFLSILLLFFYSGVIAQDFVSIEAQNKNVILEEFTGVRCPNCPQGHTTAAQILEANPDRVWVVGYHPFNSSYTEPYSGDPDFRRHHADALYTVPYCGSERFMPSAFINRREYAGEKIQSRGAWTNYTTQHLAEPSPLNVGLGTNYDEGSKQLEIIVEIYYTDDVADENTINVLFTESGMVAQQSGGTVDYVHSHVFRETSTAQWGDIITESTSQGSYIQRTFTFDNSAEEYDMEECEVVAFVVNSTNEEIVSGIGCHVGENTGASPPVAGFTFEVEEITGESVFTFTDQSTANPTTWEWTFEDGTPPNSDVQNPSGITYTESGIYLFSLTATNEYGSDTYTEEVEVEVLISNIKENITELMDVYPNPGKGIFTLALSKIQNGTLTVFDNNGNNVFQKHNLKSEISVIDLSHMATGVYFIQVVHENGILNQKIIIQ